MWMYKLWVTAILVVTSGALGAANDTWDLAVAINNQVELLSSNGTLWKQPIKKFHQLKALTYNFPNDCFIVSDMDSENDTIYTLTADHDEQTETLAVVEDLPDDIQGLAIDLLNQTVYWTDSIRKSINYIPLTNESTENNVLIHFQEEHPQDITIDICKRLIFWTNSYLMRATIERSSLDGSDRKILVDSDLFVPSGITIDQLDQRLYWADMRQGIYFRIESMNLDGGDRKILYNGTNQKPFGLAVDKDHVYWTDISNNALWKKSKFDTKEAELIRTFDDQPMGLVARNLGFPQEPDCATLNVLIEESKSKENRQTVSSDKKQAHSKEHTCVKGCMYGTVSEDCTKCKCQVGYTGETCDTYLCYNYCLNDGQCDLINGEPTCLCKGSYSGKRCEWNPCNLYCLNGGVCTKDPADLNKQAKCVCADEYKGERCEIKVTPTDVLCKKICQNISDDFVVERRGTFICNCFDGSYASLNIKNATTGDKDCALTTNLISYVTDPVFIGALSLIFVFFVITGAQSVIIYKMRNKRPRIKKRIVVNKNIQPLTYRPQSTIEQCEITIEDCCNMNVCETPCFEPSNFQTGRRKEDKKALLANMEQCEDPHTY